MPIPLIALGAAAGASGLLKGLSKSKVRNQYLSPELSNAYKDYITRLTGDQGAADKALMAYDAANLGLINQLAPIRAQNLGEINQLSDRLMSSEYDPMNLTDQLTRQRLGYLKDFAYELGQQGRRAHNLAMAGLGYSGGRGGSFVDSDRQNTISTNLAPQFGAIISGITPSVQSITAGRMGNIAGTLGLQGQREATARIGEGMELNPFFARSAVRGSELGLLGQLGQNIKNNIAGFRSDPNIFGKASEGLNSAIGTFTSLYGLGGLGKGTTPASTAPAATGNYYANLGGFSYTSPRTQLPYTGNFSYGGGAPGGGFSFGSSIVQPRNSYGSFGSLGPGPNYDQYSSIMF